MWSYFLPKLSLRHGLGHRARIVVTDDLTVPNVSARLTAFADMPPVFATAFMVAFVEATCIEAVADHLSDGEQTVGTLVNLSHIAATPIGMVVKVSVNLVQIEKRTLRFSVAVWDEVGVIGDGWHERAIIKTSRFMEKVNLKSGSAS